MLTVVLASRAFNAAASTVVSVTVTVYAWPVSVSPARVALSPSLIVAVTIPVVKALSAFACATVIAPVTVIASLPKPVNPVEA